MQPQVLGIQCKEFFQAQHSVKIKLQVNFNHIPAIQGFNYVRQYVTL